MVTIAGFNSNVLDSNTGFGCLHFMFSHSGQNAQEDSMFGRIDLQDQVSTFWEDWHKRTLELWLEEHFCAGQPVLSDASRDRPVDLIDSSTILQTPNTAFYGSTKKPSIIIFFFLSFIFLWSWHNKSFFLVIST